MSSRQIKFTGVGVLITGGVAAFALVAVLALAAAAQSGATSIRLAHVAGGGPVRIGLRKTNLGKILVNGRGSTLYAFTKDGRNQDRCVMTSGCRQVWPVVTTHGRPVAGAGVKRALLGSIALGGGTRQATYAGHPLYSYAPDNAPGDTGYVGASQFGGRWLALRASGRTAS